jgi:hypothetical protein
MSDLQVKITLGTVDINLQGEGELVYKIFKELCSEGLGALYPAISDSEPDPTESTTESNSELNQADLSAEQNDNDQSSAKPKNKSRKKGSVKPSQFIKTLDLSGNEQIISLKDFVEEKIPASNVQKTTVFVYYLQNKLALTDITIDHVFTCYKNIGARIPTNLPQNIADACSSRFGYLDRTNGKLSVSVAGTNFVEHDLPPKE